MCGSSLKKVVSVASLGLVNADGLSAPDTPDVPTAPDTPTEVDAGVTAAREDERRRRAAAAGLNSTILTSASGVASPANTGQKTLLGA